MYSGCGGRDFVCFGSRNSETAVQTGGCIEEANCDIFLRVRRDGSNFKWLLAFKFTGSDDRIILAVTRNKTSLRAGDKMPSNIPYFQENWNWASDKSQNSMVAVELCADSHSQYPDCKSDLEEFENIPKEFIKFRTFHSSKENGIEYIQSTFESQEALYIREETKKTKRFVLYELNLVRDKLTISLIHRKTSQGSKETILINKVDDIDPFQWFDQKGTNLLWLWILLAVIGVVIILVILYFVFRRRKPPHPKHREPAKPVQEKPKNGPLHDISGISTFDVAKQRQKNSKP